MTGMRRARSGLLLPALVAAAVACSCATASAARPHWTPYDRPATNGMTSHTSVPIKMRDGVLLDATVIRPDKPGRYPVLVTETPYNKLSPISVQYPYLVDRGYVQVVVDVRGTGASQGSWDSFGRNE